MKFPSKSVSVNRAAVRKIHYASESYMERRNRPPKGTTERLMKDSADAPELLKRCLHRLEWDRTQQRIKQEEEDRLEEERQAMGSIDWHDFVVAETIEFDAGEEEGLPEPLAPRDLVAAVKREIYGEEEMVAEEEAAAAVRARLHRYVAQRIPLNPPT